jgi:hypothetical protein
MRILFERSGGFMGRTINLDLELDELPEEEAANLRYLLKQADFFSLSPATTPRPARDDFQYSITVDQGDLRHTLHVSDMNAPADLRPLLHELSRRARSPMS